jgi:hypothetical protein
MALRVLAALLVWLALSASFLHAQDNPPPPPTLEATVTLTPSITPTAGATIAVTTEGIIFSADVEVIFPAGVRFTTIILRNPTQVAALALTIERDDQPPITFDIDPEDALVEEEPNPLFAYFWALDDSDAPALFEEIRYRWTVRSVFDEVNTASGVFQFTDARLLWQTRDDTGQRFGITLPRGINLTTLGRSMDAVYNLLTTNTGEHPALNIVLYDVDGSPYGCVPNADGDPIATGPFSGEEVVCNDPSLAEQIFAASGYEVVTARLDDFANIQAALTAHFVARFYAPLWQPRHPAAWFISGLSDLYSPPQEGDLLPLLTTAARNRTLLSLSELDATTDTPRSLWRAQATGLLLYIVDTFGIETVYRLARELPNYVSFADAYAALTERPAAALIPAFSDWVLTDRSAAAFGSSLYGVPTATAQASATFTPFPATRTPRPAPSATPLPTITLTPSPRPTITPTASVTPRPPGSLDTATPIPTQTNQPLIDTGSRTSTLAVFVIIVAVLVIIYAGLGRQR